MGRPKRGTRKTGEKQHYVPAFYLRNFARKSKSGNIDQIYVYDLEAGKSWMTAVENAGSERGFYVTRTEAGQQVSIEEDLNRLETIMAPVLERFLTSEPRLRLSGAQLMAAFAPMVPGLPSDAPHAEELTIAVGGLSPADWAALALFCATMYTRGPALRRLLRQWHDHAFGLARTLPARRSDIRPEDIEQLRVSDNDIAHGMNQAIFDTAHGLTNIFLHRGWVIAKTDPQHPLITSDNPFVRWSPDGNLALWAQDLETWLPLSPTLALGFFPRDDGGPPLPVQYILHLKPEQVWFMNDLQVEQAVRFLYSLDDTGAAALRHWKDATAQFPLTWERLIRREPRLEQLRAEMMQVRDTGQQPYFCAKELWHGVEGVGGYGERLARLVGEQAESDDPVITSFDAHQLAVDVLAKSLPSCRNCTCYDDTER